MSMLIVDGYNVIHAWPSLKRLLSSASLEDARDELVRRVAVLGMITGESVTVVFETHRQAAANVREAAEAVGRPIALLGDLQGPKIRTGEVDGTFQKLVRGRSVRLVPTRSAARRDLPNGGEVKEIHVSHPELVEALRPGDRVLLDDGRIELAVRASSDGHADATVVRGGLLGSRKGVSVPGRALPLPALTEKDIHDL